MDLSQIGTIVNNPLAAAGAAALGLSATLKEVREWYSAIWGWLTSKKGQTTLSDISTLNADVQKILTDNGVDAAHPALKQIEAGINTALAALPKTAAAVILGLLLVGSAQAGVNFGVPVSPTAGASYIDIAPTTMPALFKVGAGAVWTVDTSAAFGFQAVYKWGPNYGLGLGVGALVEGGGSTPTHGEGYAGVIGELLGGEAGALWANDGCRVGVTWAWGVGAQVN
jgi:hypothetical protein